jgi:hypothetical protein
LDGGHRPAVGPDGPGGVEIAPPRLGTLTAVTTNLRAGYLRRNDVPYSENAVVAEYLDRVTEFGND